jgi:hypothetical protein
MLTIAFAFALALSIARVGELALRPHQRKQFQAFADVLTLRLDDTVTRSRNAFAVLRHIKSWHLYIASTLALLLGAVLMEWPGDVAGAFAAPCIWAAILFAVGGGFWRVAKPVLDWLNLDYLTLAGIGRFALGLSAYAALLFVRIGSDADEDSAVGIIALLLSVPISAFSFYLLFNRFSLWVRMQLIGFCILPLFVFISVGLCVWLVAVGLLRAVVALLWRIVEHPSGAWSGLVYLATGVLGVAVVLSGS